MKLPFYENKQKYLNDIYFKLGHKDLCLCYNYFKDGDMRWSKWVKYSDLMEVEPDRYIKGFFKTTRDEFIEKCTHRSIAPVEVVFDVDDTNGIIYDGIHFFDSILDKSRFIHDSLVDLGYTVMVSFTQSKSYHLHIIEPYLDKLSVQGRVKYKQDLLGRFSCDVQKGTSRCMISMLGSKHYKSGKSKVLLDW